MNIDMSHIPSGRSGNWTIEDFHADEFWYKISLAKHGRGVPPGKYKRLTRNGEVIMSNTPDEIRDFMPFVYRAAGSILINGLGLGVVLTALLEKEEVTKVIVIEKSEDVIYLVSPSFTDQRVTIIHADAYEYTPTQSFDYVWHDIWDHITSDNLKYMTKLHRKYARKTTYQDSWCKRECQRIRDMNKSYYY